MVQTDGCLHKRPWITRPHLIFSSLRHLCVVIWCFITKILLNWINVIQDMFSTNWALFKYCSLSEYCCWSWSLWPECPHLLMAALSRITSWQWIHCTPQSPDLNPVEHLGDVEEGEIWIMEMLPTHMHQSHLSMDCEECSLHLTESEPWRMTAVLKAKVDPTQYLQGEPNKVVRECIYYKFFIPGYKIFKCVATVTALLNNLLWVHNIF